MNAKPLHTACFILIAMCLQSCCWFNKGEVISTIQLSEEDKALIPYQNEEIIAYQHSEGYAFEVLATPFNRFFGNQEHCEDYYVYEAFEVNLNSSLPRLAIKININKWNEEDDAFFGMRTDDLVSFTEDTSSIPEDIVIDNVVFSDLKSYKSNDELYYISEIIYNTSSGVVRINYIDQTYVQMLP